MAIINVVDGGYSVYNRDGLEVTLRSDGRVTWYPGGTFKTKCPVDTLYFPYDRIECDIVVQSWAYRRASMQFKVVIYTSRSLTIIYQPTNYRHYLLGIQRTDGGRVYKRQRVAGTRRYTDG